jgi:hypothetical protein
MDKQINMDYKVYLFSCLLKQYNTEYDELPYDTQYDLAKLLWKDFDESTYNDPNRGLYECLIDYFSDGNFDL